MTGFWVAAPAWVCLEIIKYLITSGELGDIIAAARCPSGPRLCYREHSVTGLSLTP